MLVVLNKVCSFDFRVLFKSGAEFIKFCTTKLVIIYANYIINILLFGFKKKIFSLEYNFQFK
jgi:hypothetical protein